jgi:hypothetical protein
MQCLLDLLVETKQNKTSTVPHNHLSTIFPRTKQQQTAHSIVLLLLSFCAGEVRMTKL